MKHLIIYTHLNPQSFTKAIVDEVKSVSEGKGDEVQVIDLYSDGFNPVLAYHDIEYMFMGKEAPDDLKRYQELITWADHMTFVYPLWWAQMPAMLKGWIDRVFANGFAFSYEDGLPRPLLADKTAHVYISTGTPSDLYKASGMHDAQHKVIVEGVFGFCGIKTEMTFFGEVATGTDELRKSYLASIRD